MFLVSIHAPRGARPLNFSNGVMLLSVFQSTRPRGARRNQLVIILPPYAVSIHAPTRGATTDKENKSPNPRVSIHAPTRGATLFHLVPFCSKWFQSTRPRGARRLGSVDDFPSLLFQSTRPRGARPSNRIDYPKQEEFQSTRPRGARPVREQTNLNISR